MEEPLLMKPFQNSLKVHYCPINPSVNHKELNHLIKMLKPKHIISPYADVSQIKKANANLESDEETKQDQYKMAVADEEELNCLNITHSNCVVD
jgi:hypothetical protein